jgi:hypothetical protein
MSFSVWLAIILASVIMLWLIWCWVRHTFLRGGRLAIYRFTDAAEALLGKVDRAHWKRNESGKWYVYDVRTRVLVTVRMSEHEETLTVGLHDGREAKALFREGALVILFLGEDAFDDTSPEFRSARVSWHNLLNQVRRQLGHGPWSLSDREVDDEHVDTTEVARDQRRLQRAEKEAKLGGRPVDAATRKMAKRHRRD